MNKPAKKAAVTKIRVSQATIDKIKKQGMTASLRKASTASPEMKEGLLRMYGAARVAAATKSTKVAPRNAMIDGATKKSAAKKIVVPRGAMVDGMKTTSRVTKKTKPAAQKTKQLKNNPLVKFVTSRVGGKSGGYGQSK